MSSTGRHLGELHVGDADAPVDSWEEFKRLRLGLPPIAWDAVWATVYNELVEPARARDRFMRVGYMPINTVATSSSTDAMTPPVDYEIYRIQQRDDLRRTVDRAEQQAQDVAAEVAHLERARDAIIRPRGLVPASSYLAYSHSLAWPTHCG
jgi:hypothetical protein